MVIHQFRPVMSGAELQAERLAIKLIEHGHPMQVLTEMRLAGSLPEEEFQGIQIHRVRFPLAYKLYYGVVETFRHLVRHRHTYDILHVHQAFAHAVVSVIVARCFGKKCLVKIACAGSYGDLSLFSTFSGFPWALRILRQADALIAISREVETELVEQWGFDCQRVRLIPNGVDTDAFLRTRLFVAPPPFRFILIGRRTPQKGIDTALQATRLLVDRGLAHQFEVKFYGLDYPEYDYRSLAHQLRVDKQVEFLPFQEATHDILQAAHCLLLPSRGEGLSNALLEGMAMEMPVIASTVSGTVDVITDGVDGLLIPPDAPDRLAEAMAAVMDDTDWAMRLGQAARQRVVDHFSLDRVARNYCDLYQQLHPSSD
jgi:glycosyltransferase involved in cell wall biosynthesis